MRERKGSLIDWRRNALRNAAVYPPITSYHFKLDNHYHTAVTEVVI